MSNAEQNDRATLRDVLSHRTGFTVPGLLQANTGLSSDEILRRASSAEALAPFRQRFLYNNVQYLAAGSAAAAAAGTSWDALIKARILAPLGMAATRTSLREAWTDPRTARGYWWDEAGQRLQLVTLETLGTNIDGILPAGAISSTALDMTAWLRFLLRQGVQDGKALISPAALTTTWTPQTQVGGGVGYGMGWFVRNWQGQRLIGHDGAIGGFSAYVGLLPDSNVHPPAPAPVLRLTPVAFTLPTVDEIMKLRRIPAASAIATMRTSGSVRFPQSGVEGRFSSSTAGDDRLRVDLDLDGSMHMRTVLNKSRASGAVSGGRSTELTGKQLAQTRLGHPSVLFGDWRKYDDAVRVVRAGALGGRTVYGVQLQSAGLPPTLVALDAETGDVLQTRQTIPSGDAGATAVTTTYSDYREVGGMRVPHSYIVSNEMTGRVSYQVERVEIGVELAPDTFALQPSTAPGQAQ